MITRIAHVSAVLLLASVAYLSGAVLAVPQDALIVQDELILDDLVSSHMFSAPQPCAEREPDPYRDPCFDMLFAYPDSWVMSFGEQTSDRVTLTFGELRQLIRDWHAHAEHADGPR